MSNPFSQINGYNYTNPYISNHTGYNGFTGPPGNQTNTQYQDNSNLVNNLQFGQSPGLSSPQQSVQYPQIQVCKPSDSPNYNGVHSSPQNSSFNSSFGNLPSGGQPSPHLGNLPSGGQPSPHHGNLPSVGQQSPHLGNLPSGGQPSPQTNQGSLPLFPPASPLFPPVSPLYNPPPISPTLNALASSAANAFNPAVSPVTPQVQGLPSPVLPKRPNNSVPSRAQPSGTEIKNSPQSSTGARAVSPTEQFLQELLNLEKDYKVPPQTNDTPVKTQSQQDQVVAANFQSQQQGNNFQNHQAGASFQNHSTNFRNPQPNNFRNPQPTNFRNPQPNPFPTPQQNNFQSPQQNNFQSPQQTPQQNNFQSPQQTNTSFANQQQTNFQPTQQPNNFTNFQNQQNNFSNQATPSNSFNNFNQNWQQGATPTPLKKEPLPAHQSFPSYNFPQNAAHQPQPAHQNHNRTLSVNVNNLHGNPQTPLRPQNSPARSLPGPPDLVHYQQQLQKSQQAALEQKQQQSQQALKQKQQQLQQLQQQQRLYQQQNQQLIQQRLHNPQNPRFPNQIRQRPAFPNQTSIPNQIPHRPRFQNQVPVPNKVPAQLRYPGQVPPPNVGPRPPQFRNLNKQTNFPPQAVPGSRQLPPYRPGYSGPRPIPRGVTPQGAHHPQFPRLPPGQPIPGKAQQFQYLQQRHPELLAAFQHRNPRGAVPLPRNPANFRPGLPPRLQQRPGFRPGIQQSPQFRPRAAETIVRVEISPEQLNRQDQQEAWKRAEAFLKTERRNRDQQQQIVSGAQPAPRGRQGSWHQPEFGTAPQPTLNALPPSISIQKLPREQSVPTAEIFNPLRDLPDSLTIKRIANNNAAVQIKRERRNSAPDVTRVVDIQELLRERREKQDKAKKVEEQNPAKETTPVEEPPPVFAGPLQDYVQERKEAQEAAIRVKRERLNSDPTDSASTNAAELFAQRRAAEEVAKKVKRERFSPPPNLESLYTTAASESATSLTVATSETGANTESQPGPTPLQVKRERHSPFQSSKTTTPETTVTSSQDYFTNKEPPQKSSFVDSLDLEVRTLIQKRKADTEAAVKVKREKLSPASEELNALHSQTEAPVLDQSLNLAKYGLTAPQNYKTFAAEASEKPNSSEERAGKKEERLKVKREAYSPPPPPLITNEICESRNEELFRPDPDRQRSTSSAEIQTFSGENTDKDMSGNPPKLPPGISVQRSQSQSSPLPNLPPGISLSRDSRDSRDSPNLPPGISFSRSQESKLSNLPSGIQVHRPSSAESSSSMDRLAGLGIQISRPAEERSSPRSNDMDRPPPKKNDMDRLSRLGISVSPSVDQPPRSEHSASPMAARLAGLGVTTSSVTEQSGSPMASRLSGLGVSVSGGLPGVSVSGGMPGISMTPMGEGPRKKPENGSNSSPGSRHSTPPSTPVRSPLHTQHFQPPEKGGPPPHHMSGPPTNITHHMGGPPPNMGGPSPHMGGPPPQKGGPPPLAKPVAQRPAPAPLPDNEDMDTNAMEEEEEDERESPKENGSASPQEGTEDAAVLSKPEDAGNLSMSMNEGPKKGKKKGKRGRSPNKSPNKSPRGDTSGESTERSPRVSRGRPKPNVSYEEVPDEYEMMDMDDMEPPLKIAAETDEASKKKTEVQNNKDNKDKKDSKDTKEAKDSEKPEGEDLEKPEGEDSEKPEGEESNEKKSPEEGKADTKGKEDKAKENESTEGAQEEENWEGYEGYEGEEGWEGYEGYEEGAEGWEGYEGYEGEEGYEGYEGYEEGDESDPKEKDDSKDKEAKENNSKKKDTESPPEEDEEEEEGETIDSIKKFVKDGEAEKKNSDENTDKETEGGTDLLKMAEDAEKAAAPNEPKEPPPAQPPPKPQAPSNLPKGLSNISFSRLESPDDNAKNDHAKKPGPSPTLPPGISMTNLPPGISASPIPNLPPGISVSSPANLPNLPAGISVSSPANNLPPGISISPFKKPSSSIRQSFDQDDNRSISSQDRDTSYDRGDSDYDDSRSTHSMDNIDRTPKVGSETSCVFCFNKCGDRRPKLLTCLHTACSICFMDKLAAAKADRHSSDVIDIDGDGIQMAPEVTCGLCKATTFEDETIDNLFISACDGEEDKGDETPNYCNSCEEGALATTWCNDCEEYLCRDCVRAHMRVKMTKDHQVTSVSTGMSGSAPATYNYCTIHKNEKLSLYCETCDSLNCRDCQLSEKHRNHTYRYGYEVAPEVKASLMQSLSDIKMKKNVLEEGRGILGTKISEINIKERSLLTQLKDVKNFLVSKIEARHKELTTLVTNRVRERRKVLEGRKSNVDRAYNQAEYGTAFVENAINGNVEDEKILLTKKMMQRQLKKLKRSNNSADLRPNEMEFKLDLYFQHFSGQNLHSNLDNVLKMVMSDITVSDIAPEPPKPKPKPTPPPAPSPAMSGPPMRPQNTTPQKNVMGGPGAGMRSPQQGMGRGSPARGTPVGRQMTPQKQIVARSPIRQPSPARPGQQQMTMVRGGGNARGGRGRPPMQNQGGVRMQGGRGMQQQQSPGRGSMTRGGMTRGGMQYGSSGSTIQRGRGAPGMAGRGMPQSPVRGSMTRGGGMQGGRGAMQGGIVRGRGGTIGRAGAVQQITRGVRPQMGRGGGGGVQRPMMIKQQPGLRPAMPTIRSAMPAKRGRPAQHQQQNQQYTNAVLGLPTPQGAPPNWNQTQGISTKMQGTPNDYMHSQPAPPYMNPAPRHPAPRTVVPQQPPGSSWHTPSAATTNIAASTAAPVGDIGASFKIKLPSMGRGKPSPGIKKENPEIIDLDDGPPPLAVRTNNPGIDALAAQNRPGLQINRQEDAVDPLAASEQLNIMRGSGGGVVRTLKTEPNKSANVVRPNSTQPDSIVAPDFSSLMDDDVGASPDWIQTVPNDSEARSHPMVQIMPGDMKSEPKSSSATVELPPTGAGIKLELGSAPVRVQPPQTVAPSSSKRPLMEGSATKEKADGGSSRQEKADGDWCAVCHDGGDTLYCCDNCPKVYHLYCYVPPLMAEPPDDWVCLMCSTIDDILSLPTKVKKGRGNLSERDLKMCRRLLFEMYNLWPESVPFRDCADLNFPQYLEKIKDPIALDVIKERLDEENADQYSSIREFLADLRKMFRNCFLFNSKESEIYRHAKRLEEKLDQLLEQWLPDFAFDPLTDLVDKPRPSQKRAGSPQPGPSKKRRVDQGGDFAGKSKDKKKKKKKKKKHRKDESEDSSDMQEADSDVSDQERNDYLIAMENSLQT